MLKHIGVVFTACCLGAAGLANAQAPDCMETEAALQFWRPVFANALAPLLAPYMLVEPLIQCLNSPIAELTEPLREKLKELVAPL